MLRREREERSTGVEGVARGTSSVGESWAEGESASGCCYTNGGGVARGGGLVKAERGETRDCEQRGSRSKRPQIPKRPRQVPAGGSVGLGTIAAAAACCRERGVCAASASCCCARRPAEHSVDAGSYYLPLANRSYGGRHLRGSSLCLQSSCALRPQASGGPSVHRPVDRPADGQAQGARADGGGG